MQRSGQRGCLRLRFEPRDSRTVLADRYARAPFGSVRAGYPDRSGIPEVQIMNPSGGTLGGDRLRIDVSLAPGASAAVLTQAAGKAYRGREAAQDAFFDVGDGAFLEYLPHHLIPFAGSNYRQTAEFRLAGSATLLAWDAFSAGRVVRGERFAFDRLASVTRLYRENLPEVVDGFELRGGGEPFGGYSYLGSLHILDSRNLAPLADELHERLNGPSPDGELRWLSSASAPATGLCAVRVLARDATALYEALNACRAVVRARLDLPPPAREVW